MSVKQRTESERILAARDQFVPRGIATTPIVVAWAEGARVEDVDGKTYIDFAGGLGCQNTGHQREKDGDAARGHGGEHNRAVSATGAEVSHFQQL